MRLALLTIVLLASSLARADKVAILDPDRLYQKGGITRWLDARKQLDADHAKFRIVESPDGKSVKPTSCDNDSVDKKFCEKLKEANSKSEATRVWYEHERSVLGQIEREVTAEIQVFARSQRIDVLLRKDHSLLYVSPAADVTDASIKSMNATPKPKAVMPR